MTGSDQAIGAVATLLGVQLLALALAVTARRRRTAGTDDGDPAACVDGDRVECPSCGTENELGHRFCRNCVQTLPAGRTVQRDRGSTAFPGAF